MRIRVAAPSDSKCSNIKGPRKVPVVAMELFSYEKEKRKKNRKKREREKGKQLILKFTSTVNTIHGARERPGRAGNLSTSTTSSLSSRRGDFRVTRDHVLAKHACFAAESNGSVIESAIRPERLIGMQ